MGGFGEDGGEMVCSVSGVRGDSCYRGGDRTCRAYEVERRLL